MADSLLQVRNLRAGYRDAVVLDDISFAIPQKGGLAVLGRNGAGKTTLVLAIMGLARIYAGDIRFDGRSLIRLAAHKRARAGLGWVSQERDIFRSLTVEENLTAAARPGRWTLERVYDLFPRLAERRRNKGDRLSGGEQQMLAFGRAVMTNPRLLLLDEPLEGLAPTIVEELTGALRRMTLDEGTAFLIVEQRVETALALSTNCLIIERGRIAFSGPTDAVVAAPSLIERYVGLAIEPGDHGANDQA